jgi:hypothetical protein
MAAIVLVAAAGVFVLGAVAGIMAVVSYGIHREQKLLRGEQGILAGPDAPDYFLAEQAPDVVSGAARRLNGLYVHRLSPAILGGRGSGPGGSQGWGRAWPHRRGKPQAPVSWCHRDVLSMAAGVNVACRRRGT